MKKTLIGGLELAETLTENGLWNIIGLVKLNLKRLRLNRKREVIEMNNKWAKGYKNKSEK